MLKLNKNITLNGVSMINGVQVVYMNATISTDGAGNSGINKTITDKEMYNANKKQVRADMTQFEEEVYNVEDELLSSKENENEDE